MRCGRSPDRAAAGRHKARKLCPARSSTWNGRNRVRLTIYVLPKSRPAKARHCGLAPAFRRRETAKSSRNFQRPFEIRRPRFTNVGLSLFYATRPRLVRWSIETIFIVLTEVVRTIILYILRPIEKSVTGVAGFCDKTSRAVAHTCVRRPGPRVAVGLRRPGVVGAVGAATGHIKMAK